MAKHIRIASGAPWEAIVGYSRTVRAGNHVFVSGTTCVSRDGRVEGAGDVGAQTASALENIKSALEKAGASMSDVVRTRMFVVDIDQWERVAEAHLLYFSDVRPATTMVEVSRLIRPELLIEIEADAVIQT